jgi:N-acetylglucosaminyldiphosphoundecaprenol N-acetyl-beta-D-mannosaminyltransferase
MRSAARPAARHGTADDDTVAPTEDRPLRRRIRIGKAWIDAVTFDDALAAIATLVEARRGGIVVTPNVDHIVRLEHDSMFRDVYGRAELALADGTPVMWAARLLATPLPEKVSGSDLTLPVARLAASRGWRVYLLGGAPGAAAAAAARMSREFGANVVGVDAPAVTAEGDQVAEQAIVERIQAARPDLIFVALGSPKQERFCERIRERVGPAVLLGVGVSLSFVAGYVRRAPRLISRLGLEWLYRLVQEPRRLWRRYLVEDPQFLGIVWRTSRMPRAERMRVIGPMGAAGPPHLERTPGEPEQTGHVR